MRISGKGPGGYSSGGGNRDRQSAFRRNHRVGDKLKGRLIKWERSGMAWVRVDGYELLASVQNKHEHGAILHFLVKQLSPEIILQELTGGSGYAVPGDLFKRFQEEAAETDNRLQDVIDKAADVPASDPDKRKSTFLQGLRNDPKAMRGLASLAKLMAHINNLPEVRAENGRFLLKPWLMPKAKEQEIFVRYLESGPPAPPGKGRPPMMELIYSFRLEHLGRCRLQILYRDPEVRFRVLTEAAEHIPDLKTRMETRFPETSDGPQCLGVNPLNPGTRDILGRFFQPSSQGVSVGFNVRA